MESAGLVERVPDARPRGVHRVLVPVVRVLSMLPGLLLLATGFIPARPAQRSPV
jgi:hypothetical protein